MWMSLCGRRHCLLPFLKLQRHSVAPVEVICESLMIYLSIFQELFLVFVLQIINGTNIGVCLSCICVY